MVDRGEVHLGNGDGGGRGDLIIGHKQIVPGNLLVDLLAENTGMAKAQAAVDVHGAFSEEIYTGNTGQVPGAVVIDYVVGGDHAGDSLLAAFFGEELVGGAGPGDGLLEPGKELLISADVGGEEADCHG